MDGRSRGILKRGALACHCLLLETASGLVLCDTGLGLQDIANPGARLSSFFLSLLSPDFPERHPTGLRLNQWMMDKNRSARVQNQYRLR